MTIQKKTPDIFPKKNNNNNNTKYENHSPLLAEEHYLQALKVTINTKNIIVRKKLHTWTDRVCKNALQRYDLCSIDIKQQTLQLSYRQ